ncbi:MAG: hypothetical protein KAQ63_02200 [Candidatus Moranbacteria bacterium]|nr:hypothetical protein [Candidatus Moranbacteria bacterium]
MKNINLKSEDLIKKKVGKSDIATALSVVILVIIFSAYGIIYGFNYYKEKDSARIKNEMKSIEKSLGDEKYVEMYDFNMRLIDFKNRVSRQGFLPETRNIINISNNTLPFVSFTRLMLEDKGGVSHYSIEMLVPDHATLVKQIKAYKQMETSQNFMLKSNEEEKTGGFLASMSFDLGGESEAIEIVNNTEEDF